MTTTSARYDLHDFIGLGKYYVGPVGAVGRLISAADVGWQTPSAAVISATGIVHDKWQAKVSIKKAKKEFESKLAKNIKEDKNLFLHMPEAKVKEKSKLDH